MSQEPLVQRFQQKAMKLYRVLENLCRDMGAEEAIQFLHSDPERVGKALLERYNQRLIPIEPEGPPTPWDLSEGHMHGYTAAMDRAYEGGNDD